MLARLGDELETLEESLSEEHDLTLLRQRVVEPEQPMDNQSDLEALIALIDQRRADLQAEAEQLGKRGEPHIQRSSSCPKVQLRWNASGLRELAVYTTLV
jgi:hypothetical protein